jgi:hypothetical protein
MATSKDRRGVLFGRITKKNYDWGFWSLSRNKNEFFHRPENPENSIIQNIGCRHAFIWTA